MTEKTTMSVSTDSVRDTSGETRHFFAEIGFDGSGFQGWQSQPHGNTVQQTLEKTLTRLFAGQKIRVAGSGRTDAGVHARGMVATFSVPPWPQISDEQVFQALNRLLPPTIRIRKMERTPNGFHARFSALGKAYTYIINRGDVDPFSNRYSWHVPGLFRLDALRKATEHLVGTHDFTGFSTNSGDERDPIRTLFRIDADSFGPLFCLTFVGDGFLYRMVRSMVGALVEVGTGRIETDTVREILESRIRTAAVPTCPARGLFLMKVFYRQGEWSDFHLEKPPFIP